MTDGMSQIESPRTPKAFIIAGVLLVLFAALALRPSGARVEESELKWSRVPYVIIGPGVGKGEEYRIRVEVEELMGRARFQVLLVTGEREQNWLVNDTEIVLTTDRSRPSYDFITYFNVFSHGKVVQVIQVAYYQLQQVRLIRVGECDSTTRRGVVPDATDVLPHVCFRPSVPFTLASIEEAVPR